VTPTPSPTSTPDPLKAAQDALADAQKTNGINQLFINKLVDERDKLAHDNANNEAQVFVLQQLNTQMEAQIADLKKTAAAAEKK
jgi:hypothetical protein